MPRSGCSVLHGVNKNFKKIIVILIIPFRSLSITLFKYLLFFLFWVKSCFTETIYTYMLLLSL